MTAPPNQGFPVVPLSSTLPVLPLPSIVDQDIPCRKCSYDLRGLSIEGRCPECGTPVGLSVNGELLRYSDPKFISTLARGVSLIRWGIVVLIAAVVVVMVAASAARGARPPLVVRLAPLIANVMMVAGAWLLTSRDPSGIGEDQYGTARRIIRFTLLVGISKDLLDLAVGMSTPLPPAAQIAFQTLGFATGLVWLVGQFAQLNYLHKLALRIPNPEQSQRARFLMWGLGTTYALFLVIGFVAAIALATRGRTAPGATVIGAGCAGGILFLALIVFGVMYLFMLGRFGREFKAQAALARQVWSAATTQPPVA